MILIRILIIQLLLCSSLSAQVNTLWTYLYTGKVYEQNFSPSCTLDRNGNILLTGRSSNLFVLKLNSSGTVLWNKFYGEFAQNTSHRIITDDSNNVYVTGYTVYSSIGRDILTIKYDSGGNMKWQNSYWNTSSHGWDEGLSIDTDAEGNVIVGGYLSGPNYYDGTIFKYNPSGEILWYRRVNGNVNQADRINDIVVDESGNIYACGYVTNNSSNEDYILLKYSPDGDLIWSKQHNNSNFSDDKSTSIKMDDFGDITITGMSNYDIVTIKYDTAGNQLWKEELSGYEPKLETDLAGNVYIAYVAYDDVKLTKYNRFGNIQWTKDYNYGTDYDNYANDIHIDREQNIYISVNSNNITLDTSRIVIVKFNSSGELLIEESSIANYHYSGYSNVLTDDSLYIYSVMNVLTNISLTAIIKYDQSKVLNTQTISQVIPTTYKIHQNYPNPFNPVTRIRFEIPSGVRSERSEVRLLVFDVMGREIAELVKGELQPGVYEYEFDGTGLGSGVYFYKLQSGEFTETRRMVLVK